MPAMRYPVDNVTVAVSAGNRARCRRAQPVGGAARDQRRHRALARVERAADLSRAVASQSSRRPPVSGDGFAIPHARIAGNRRTGDASTCARRLHSTSPRRTASRCRRCSSFSFPPMTLPKGTCCCWRWWPKRFRIAVSALAWPPRRARRTPDPCSRNGSAKPGARAGRGDAVEESSASRHAA